MYEEYYTEYEHNCLECGRALGGACICPEWKKNPFIQAAIALKIAAGLPEEAEQIIRESLAAEAKREAKYAAERAERAKGK